MILWIFTPKNVTLVDPIEILTISGLVEVVFWVAGELFYGRRSKRFALR